MSLELTCVCYVCSENERHLRKSWVNDILFLLLLRRIHLCSYAVSLRLQAIHAFRCYAFHIF